MDMSGRGSLAAFLDGEREWSSTYQSGPSTKTHAPVLKKTRRTEDCAIHEETVAVDLHQLSDGCKSIFDDDKMELRISGLQLRRDYFVERFDGGTLAQTPN